MSGHDWSLEHSTCQHCGMLWTEYIEALEAENVALKTERQSLVESCLKLSYMRDDAEKERDSLLSALKTALGLLDEVKAQWGDDYLWTKWGLSEAIERLRVLPPVQKAMGESRG